MCVRTSWIISIVAMVIAIGFSVTDCSGWPFDSAEEEARADIQRQDAATQNRIRLDAHNHTLALERVAAFGHNGYQSPLWIFAAMGLFVFVVVVTAALVAMAVIFRRRPLPDQAKQIYIDQNGNEFRISNQAKPLLTQRSR